MKKLKPNLEADKPLISIIMNCYNGEKYLREAISSILKQTYQNWEIIFWDNQSLDKSSEIFKSFKDERFNYYLAKNHTSLGYARNEAIKKSNGIWIGFLDVDDIWLPNKLEQQTKIINKESNDLGMVYGQAQILVSDSVELRNSQWAKSMKKYTEKFRLAILPEGLIFEQLLSDNFIPLVSALVSRKAYFAVGGINPEYIHCEDYDLFVKVSKNYLVRAVQESTAIYRVHGSNLSEKNKIVSFNESFKIISSYLPQMYARNALNSYCAVRFLQSIKSFDVEMLFIISRRCNLKELFPYIFKIGFKYLKKR